LPSNSARTTTARRQTLRTTFQETKIGATGVEVFLGTKGATPANDVGVRIPARNSSRCCGRARVTRFDASGTATLVNVADLGFTGALSAQKSTFTKAVTGSDHRGGVTRTLSIPAGMSRFGADAVTLTTAARRSQRQLCRGKRTPTGVIVDSLARRT
jgi:hypothetical protein